MAFKLRSGNDTAFKMMGSSNPAPFKHKEGDMAAHGFDAEAEYHKRFPEKTKESKTKVTLPPSSKPTAVEQLLEAREMANQADKEDDARTKIENFKNFALEQSNPLTNFYEGQKKFTNILDYTGVTGAVTGDENYNKKRFGEHKGYEGDHWVENVAEIFDPTGYLSHDDFARARAGGSTGEKMLEGLGVVPMPFSSAPKGFINLAKGAWNTLKGPLKGAAVKGMQTLGKFDAIQDIYEDNIKTKK